MSRAWQPFNIPLIGGGLTDDDRAKIRMTADAILRVAKDKTGNNVHLIVFACLHVIGYAIGRSKVAEDHGFITRASMQLPNYVNAYKQDGHRGVFSQDT